MDQKEQTPEKKKRGTGIFMRLSIIATALYVLGVIAAVIVFQARQNPIDPMTVAAMLSVGLGEFGACSLIKTASEKRVAAEAEREAAQAEIASAREEAEAARAEAEDWKAKAQKKRAPAKQSAPDPPSAPAAKKTKPADAKSASAPPPDKPPTKRKKGDSP